MHTSTTHRKGIIVPINLSKEDRQEFYRLLDELTKVIWGKADQPQPRPELRLVKPNALPVASNVRL